ncbi:FAD-dependent oxidoreductase [bacterium]|nr:FAD-dependent oxidoreductase [bacterium]
MSIDKKNIIAPYMTLKNLFRKTVTVKFPKEELDVFPGCPGVSPQYRGIHANDHEECIGCGACSDICPTDAIRLIAFEGEPREGAKNQRPEIDYGRCCFCGYCVDICSTGSLSMTRKFIHIECTPKTPDPEKEVNMIKDKFILLPDEKGLDDLGWNTPTPLSLLDLERVSMEQLSSDLRNDSFVEIVKGFSKEQAVKEASRCIECGICTDACPAGMNIPEYITAIWDNDNKASVEWMYKTNPLSNVCGRVCTHVCETVCAISHRGEPVAIRWLKRYALDQLSSDDVKSISGIDQIRSAKKKVAIVGSGPGGLAAAYFLSKMGYAITIFEKNKMAGGVMRYGIPNYRLPDEALDKDIDAIKTLGVEILTEIEIGKAKKISQLQKDFDFVILDTGLPIGRTILPDLKHDKFNLSIEMLEDISRGEEVTVEKKIAVIGGGNVAMDIARSLARLQRVKFGEVNITAISLESREELPADIEEIEEAMEEGIVLEPGWGNMEVDLDKKTNAIKGIKIMKCTQVFDQDHRFRPLFDEADVKTLQVDQIVEAIGQAPDYSFLDSYEKEVEFKGFCIKTDENGKTSLDWLWAVGDIIEGPDIVHAVSNGHMTAQAIDRIVEGNK